MSSEFVPAAPSAPSAPSVPSVPSLPTHVAVRPWFDPVLDAVGHDPRSMYAERFWLGVIGPSALWLLRSLARRFDDAPLGYELDLVATARTLGLSDGKGVASPFGRTISRCVMFGTMIDDAGTWHVRRRLPALSHRHLTRMPAELRRDHGVWVAEHSPAGTVDDYDRAVEIGAAIHGLGADPALLEHQLAAVGIAPVTAEAAARTIWARTG